MKYDVIVVGAGPAGSTTARVAAEKGLNVLLLEKDSYPGETNVCAGGIAPVVLRDFDIDPSIIERDCDCGRLICNGKMLKVKMNEMGGQASRRIFDNYLAEQAVDAGAVLKTSCAVTSVSKNKVSTQSGDFEADVIVGADGVNSIVRKSIGAPKFKPEELYLGAVYEIKMPEKSIDEKFGSGFNIYTGKDISPIGYAWVFPKKDYINVGIGTLLSKATVNIRESLDYFVKKENFEGKKTSFSAGMIPCPASLQKSGFGNTLLVGDAAGHVGSAVGEGIYYAMSIGKIAGEACAKQLEGEPASWYDEEIEKSFGNAFKIERIITKVVYEKIGVDNLDKLFPLFKLPVAKKLIDRWVSGDRNIDINNPLLLKIGKLLYNEILKTR